MGLDATVNFAKSNVSTGYAAGVTSIVLAAGGGARFPTPDFNAVWWNITDYADPSDDPDVEIVRVTAIVGDTLTIVRAQEGTADVNHNSAGKTYALIEGITSLVMSQISVAFADTPAGEVWAGPASGGAAAPAFRAISLFASASLNFGSIVDGGTAELTITVTGAVAGDTVAPAWPSAMPAGFMGMMYVSAADTVTVRLLNMSGGSVDPGALTFGARIPRY